MARVVFLWAGLSFFVGRWARLILLNTASYMVTFSPFVEKEKKNGMDSHPLSLQIQSQDEIQAWISSTQQYDQERVDCSQMRILFRDQFRKFKDGFALEVQYIGRLLQLAVATERHLVISPAFRSAYEPQDCDWEQLNADHQYKDTAHMDTSWMNNETILTPAQLKTNYSRDGWQCLWKSLPNHCQTFNMSLQKNVVKDDLLDDTSIESPMRVGILANQTKWSHYFSGSLFGTDAVVKTFDNFPPNPTPSKNTLDILHHWERIFGRFWIRAQMVHYLWKPVDGLQKQINARMPPLLLPNSTHRPPPFIGFHIRLTDNLEDLDKSFCRNATATRAFARFMQLALNIRQNYPRINTIYLATDNAAMIQESQREQYKDWNFLRQDHVVRTNRTDRMWFRNGRSIAAGAIATDIQVLRRADFLVGSFQSNVFRLAAELNLAHHVERYSVRQRRHYTVDVEWYEDP